MDANAETFAGFSPEDRAEAGLGEGTWLGYLRPLPKVLSLAYGPALKLEYNIFVPSRTGTKRFLITELASVNYATESKMMLRYGAVSNIKVNETTDLTALKNECFCLVQLVKDKESRFLNIANVMPLPHGYQIPSDIRENPAELAMVERHSATDEEIAAFMSGADSRMGSRAGQDEEPPF
jgi:hypothetical protein